jgi:polyhydroxyalkanoate synthesis regulator phasin
MPDPSATSGGRGVTEALRAAIDRTLLLAGRHARTGPAAIPRERATQLLDEVARRGREARDELERRGQGAREGLARRGQEAGAGLARRGQMAGEELVQRLEFLERRLTALEDLLRGKSKPNPKG